MEKVVALGIEEVYEALGTTPNGLSSEEAGRRLEIYGPNLLVERKREATAYRFFRGFKDLFSIILLSASLLSFLSGMWQMSLVIFVVVLVNTVFGVFQEWRAEKAMEALRHWMPEYAKVIRDGELEKVLVEELVPGDVIVLEEGDRVPADARLVESFDLWTNNVPLTGESEPQPRSSEPTTVSGSSYLYAPNIVLMSTSVVKGRGKAVVFATGMNSKFGQVAGLTLEIKDPQSPLQKEIALTAKHIFIIAMIVGGIFFLISVFLLGADILTSTFFMIGVMVACVPEALQVTVSSTLAISVMKMLRGNILVKRLSAVQTLGSVTVIATDKTGTITTGEMTVRKIWVPDKIVEISGVGYSPIGEFTVDGRPLGMEEVEETEKLLEVSALCNTARLVPPSDRNPSWGVIGDTTDGALLVAALKYGLNVQNILARKPIIHMIPFTSERKMMTTVHKGRDKIYVYTKGAPRSVLPLCEKIFVNGKTEKLTTELLNVIEEKISKFAGEGLRVIAVAYKELQDGESLDGKNIESNMVFLGLAGIKDPPRPEIRKSIEIAKKAGIRTIIITGDYGLTAQRIAQEVGIVEPSGSQSGSNRVITGVELEGMSDQQILEEIKAGCSIFALVTPVQKLRIVKILRENGEIVAVTGDGANDSPSLREADIGIAMGVSGTDIAREASDMVLLDDSFNSIVKAVESGRTVYDNIRKYITYVFTHNWAELIPFILYVVFGLPLPLLIIQVLAIDIGIDIIPSLALSQEPPEEDIMEQPPRSIKERLFNKSVFLRSLYLGIIIAAGAMFGCLNAWASGGWILGMQLDPHSPVYIKGVTMTFAGIVVGQMGNVLACRTSKTSLFKTSLKSNKWIWIGLASQIIILTLMIYVPPMQSIFGTTALGLNEWTYLALIACGVILAEEVRKWFARRLQKTGWLPKFNQKISKVKEVVVKYT